MNWFRTHITQGSRLALVALAIQMVLAFGHFHAIPAPTHGVSIERVQLPGPAQHVADHCDICAVTAMAGTMLAAVPPLLQPPQTTPFLRLAATVEFGRLAAIDIAFQARAPPLS
ncbi:MAG: hypothetical protein JWQ94_809 [Tardiphaga sp.]|nr:hypothetical protein [Tardiphaga sp.]